MIQTAWKRGDQTKLGALIGIKPQYLNDIIAGRKECRPTLAERLEKAAKQLGYNIPRAVWAFHDFRRGNPFFPKFK